MIKDYFVYTRKLIGGRFDDVICSCAFVDIVKFSKSRVVQDMRDAIHKLHDSIHDTFGELRWDEDWETRTPNELILAPTGDGYGIAFAPAVPDKEVLSHAKELSKTLAKENLSIRCGISKGPNIVYVDLNETMNIIGWGMVHAHRVMSLGDENHILCGGEFAKPMLQAARIADLHHLGKYKKKWQTMDVYNYYKDGEFGNPASPPINP